MSEDFCKQMLWGRFLSPVVVSSWELFSTPNAIQCHVMVLSISFFAWLLINYI